MMMAQQYAAHQGIPQHPGLPPGHALAPGQHPNAHPGAAMVQQMHPGVSAPGPQVTQGGPMMGQMPPGAGMNGPGPVQAHALSHLGPQAHMFPQQPYAQNYSGNPHQIMQQHHQNMLKQRMMFQQQQGQQPQPHQQQQPQQPQAQQHGGIPVSMPNGSQAINTAHMVAMQNPTMRPANMQMQQLQQMSHGQPQNLQQQQHFIAVQQAAQAQAQAQAQAHQLAQREAQQQAQQHQNAAGQPGQHTPQQRPAPHPQSVHEAQSVTPQPQPGPPPHRGSATPQPNPQAPSSQPQQQQTVVTHSQPTPNLAPQQLPQAQQSAQQPQQQQPPHAQQPQSQSQPQSQPQPQPGQQGHAGQQQGQQPHPMTAQEAQMKAQQQQQQNAAMLMQQQRLAMRGQSILTLGTFAEQLSGFASRGEAVDLAYWQTFVEKFYSPAGVLRQGVYNPQAGSKQFEIATPALPRYYLTQFSSGIRQIQMLIEAPREKESPNGGHVVECAKASFIYWFTNDAQLFATGTLRAHFDFQNKIEMLDIVIMNHTEYLPRSQLQVLETPDLKQSPKVTKNTGKRAQKQAQQPAFTLPESMVTSNGVPTPVMSFLEVAETISQMQLLFQYSHQHPDLTPSESLRSLVGNIQSQGPNPGLMPGQMNPPLQQGLNGRAPSIGGPNQFASPAMGHLSLPGGIQGSPHLTGSAHPSPAQSNLPGPPGMGQQGQMPQQIASASASPSVSNKRRRASTVKMEADDGGAEVNGTAPAGPAKVKASPRVGGKRQKGTAS
ncbi:LIM-domain binding protein-domain-containing protein [Aspergillus californicus]